MGCGSAIKKEHFTLLLVGLDLRELSLIPLASLHQVLLEGFSVLVHFELTHFVVMLLGLAGPWPGSLLSSTPVVTWVASSAVV